MLTAVSMVVTNKPKGTPWMDLNHISAELSFLGKKKRLQVDKLWGNQKELTTVHTICSRTQNIVRRWDWSLHSSSSTWSFRRMASCEMFGWCRCCMLSIPSPEILIIPWKKRHWSCYKLGCFNSAGNNS